MAWNIFEDYVVFTCSPTSVIDLKACKDGKNAHKNGGNIPSLFKNFAKMLKTLVEINTRKNKNDMTNG
jgi:hypothetical protein